MFYDRYPRQVLMNKHRQFAFVHRWWTATAFGNRLDLDAATVAAVYPAKFLTLLKAVNLLAWETHKEDWEGKREQQYGKAKNRQKNLGDCCLSVTENGKQTREDKKKFVFFCSHKLVSFFFFCFLLRFRLSFSWAR